MSKFGIFPDLDLSSDIFFVAPAARSLFEETIPLCFYASDNGTNATIPIAMPSITIHYKT